MSKYSTNRLSLCVQGHSKKGAVLFIVLAMILISVILANVILSLILSQARLTHHQISRIRAYYAAFAGMNYTTEMLRTGAWTPDSPGGANKYACLNSCIDAVIPSYNIPNDSDIPYNVQVTIYPAQSGINNTTRLDITTEYTYNP